MTDRTRSGVQTTTPAQPDVMMRAAIDATRRDWRAIELYAVGPDGTCHCGAAKNCKSSGKHPRNNGWQNAEQLSDADIHTIWTTRPRANLGIATGVPSGFFVLDIDPDHGGIESAQRLAAEHGPLGQTRVVRTGSGGFHYYFAMPDFEVTNRHKWFLENGYPGIDIRGTGGQVVAPPSRTDKGYYSVIHDHQPGPAPAWLLAAVQAPEVTEPKAVVPAPQTPPPVKQPESPQASPASPAVAPAVFDKYVERAREGIRTYLADRKVIDPHGWNNSTYEQACKLIELGNATWTEYDLDNARADLYAWAPRDEGFSAIDVERCWQSAVRSVGGKARIAPTGGSPSVRDDFADWGDIPMEPGLAALLAKSEQPARREPSTPLHPWTDYGNAGRLYDLYSNTLRWVEQRGRFAHYADGHWSVDDARVAHGLAHTLVENLHLEGVYYDEIPVEGEKLSERQQFYKWAKTQGMRARIEAALAELRGKPGMQAKLTDFDRDPMLLNVANGIVDLHTGNLKDSSPELMLMLQCPVDYDPRAQAPKWVQFLNDCLPSAEIRSYLQRVVGYSLTGSMAEQAMFIHHGTGANGKSVFLQVMTALAGDYGQVVPRSTLLVKDREGHPTDVARMVGKRFLQTSETAAGRRLDEEVVKGLTGGEQQTARHMREEFFDFTPQGKIHYVTNHLPRLTDAESIWRRLHLIKWGVVIEDHLQVKDLAAQIIADELPGVLAWAVQGALAWQATGGLHRPLETLRDLAEYRGDQDEFGDFLAVSVDVTGNERDRATTKELFELYQRWAFDSGMKHAMHAQDFGRAMRERKFTPWRSADARGYCGLVIKGNAKQPVKPEDDIDSMFRRG